MANEIGFIRRAIDEPSKISLWLGRGGDCAVLGEDRCKLTRTQANFIILRAGLRETAVYPDGLLFETA